MSSLRAYYQTVRSWREGGKWQGHADIVEMLQAMEGVTLPTRQQILRELRKDIHHLRQYYLPLFHIAMMIETKYYQHYLTVLTASYLLIDSPYQHSLWPFYLLEIETILLKKYRYISSRQNIQQVGEG